MGHRETSFLCNQTRSATSRTAGPMTRDSVRRTSDLVQVGLWEVGAERTRRLAEPRIYETKPISYLFSVCRYTEVPEKSSATCHLPRLTPRQAASLQKSIPTGRGSGKLRRLSRQPFPAGIRWPLLPRPLVLPAAGRGCTPPCDFST